MLSPTYPAQKEYSRAINRMGWSMMLFIGLLYAFNIPAEMLAMHTETVADPVRSAVLTVVSGVLSTLAYMAPFIGAGVFYLFLSRKTVTQRMRLELTMPPRFPLLILAGLGVITLGSYLNAAFCALIGFSETDEILITGNFSNPANVVNYMTSAIAPAFAEEFLFRGVYYTNLRPYGRTQAVLISALLFALMHQNPAQILYTFMAGVVMAMMYELTGSIWCGILFHLLNNEIAVISEILVYGKYGEAAIPFLQVLDGLTVLLGLASILILYLLRDGKPQRNWGWLGRGRRRLLCSREVPPAEGEARIRDRSAASLSSWRALTTPGMIVFTSVSSGIMLFLWLSVLIANAM
jgi:membrane protease YdiL (CAAX protease family)